jgi:hypothetical protein
MDCNLPKIEVGCTLQIQMTKDHVLELIIAKIVQAT